MKFSPLFSALLIVLSLSLNATATVRYVNIGNSGPAAPYTSWNTASTNVQTALNACVSGDQVWVAQGTYFENITLPSGVALYGGFAGTESQLDQRDWKSHLTTLDGRQLNCVVIVATGATGSTRIDGFTIRNGNGGSVGAGGVKCSKATMTIANNSITDNTGNFGAGISCSQSSLLIVSNLIQNNNSISGGVIRSVSSTSTIRNNQIIGNVVQLTLGGSILLTLDRGTDISDNLIFGNSFQGSSGGFDGTGIQVMVSTSCSIRNNTIVWNDSGAQASISLISTTNSVVANNIIGFAYAGISSYQDVTASIHNNCLFANMQNYLRIPDQTGSNGNISMNPQFAVNDSYPEFHLSAASPCRDSGDNSMVLAGDTDVDGGERILGGTVDMGAFEFGNSVTPYVSTIVRVSPAGNDANDGSSWGTAKRTVQSAINQERFSGGEVWVAAGMYLENLTLQTGVHLYGGFSGNETARDQRNAKANLTVLDGNRIAPVISLQYLFGWNTIDGFTIQNGFRGGIYAIGSAPIIANNTITKNSSSYGGIYATWSAGGDALGGRGWILTNNVISSNQATLGAGGYFVGGYPTGLCLFAANNRFEGNVATNGSASRSAGGALYMYLGSAYVANNLFLNNVATNGPGSYTAQGGAICLNQAMMQIFNNTFVGNMAIDNSGSNSGGAVYSMGAAPVVANNLILYGSSGVVGGYFPTDLRNNCVYGNLLNYQGTDLTGTNGNISVDPQLAGPGDYHLSSGSPCINAGLNAYATNDFDFDGNPRISGGTVDIGAYEFQNPASTISYAWLQQYGLPVDGSADTADTDGDRLNNWQEWRAGTSPIDSASVLKMLTLTNGISGTTVSWQSVSGINYVLQRSDLISGAGFSTIQSNIVGQAGSTSFTDTNAVGTSKLVYRVGVQP